MFMPTFGSLTVFLYEILIHKCYLVRVWGVVQVLPWVNSSFLG